MTYRHARPSNPSNNGWSLALPAVGASGLPNEIGYAGHWRTKADAEKAFADRSSPYYGGFYNGVRGRLTNTCDWRDDVAWKCPIGWPGCTSNCGNYGCGN